MQIRQDFDIMCHLLANFMYWSKLFHLPTEAHSSQGDPPHYVSEFTSMVHNVSWNLLVHDKRIIDFPDLSTNEKMDWIKASDSLMFFCYQSFGAVVILNLLIAIMNATIQR